MLLRDIFNSFHIGWHFMCLMMVLILLIPYQKVAEGQCNTSIVTSKSMVGEEEGQIGIFVYNGTYNDRPYYFFNTNATSYPVVYLYYNPPAWVLCDDLTNQTGLDCGWGYANDSAADPSLVTAPWNLWAESFGFTFGPDPTFVVECKEFATQCPLTIAGDTGANSSLVNGDYVDCGFTFGGKACFVRTTPNNVTMYIYYPWYATGEMGFAIGTTLGSESGNISAWIRYNGELDPLFLDSTSALTLNASDGTFYNISTITITCSNYICDLNLAALPVGVNASQCDTSSGLLPAYPTSDEPHCALACSAGYIGEVSAITCSWSGLDFDVTSNCTATCSLDTSVVGIDGSQCQGAIPDTQCTLNCLTNYDGIAPTPTCNTAGGNFTINGSCTPKCTLDTSQIGIDGSQCQGMITDTQCTLSCLNNYDGIAPTPTCNTAGGNFTINGSCTPKCSFGLPVSGIDNSQCQGTIVASQCILGCLPNYVDNAPTPSCTVAGGNFAINGSCLSTCQSVLLGTCPDGKQANINTNFSSTVCANSSHCSDVCCHSLTCDSFTCPTGQVRKTGLIPCTGVECTNVQCCDVTCSSFSCGVGLHLKATGQTPICLDGVCSTAQCCEGTCSSILGSSCPVGRQPFQGLSFDTTQCLSFDACLNTCCQSSTCGNRGAYNCDLDGFSWRADPNSIPCPDGCTRSICCYDGLLARQLRSFIAGHPSTSDTATWTSTDPCEWEGVACDASGSFLGLTLSGLSGQIDFSLLPPGIQSLDLSSLDGAQLSGSLDLTHLPSSLTSLKLPGNRLAGSIDLSQLPPTLQVLDLSGNLLVGTIDLTHLPTSLTSLVLSNNALSGNLVLTKLPQSLQSLHLSSNIFTGSIDLSLLPLAMQTLDLSGNKLNANPRLQNLPSSLQWIDLSSNAFAGKIDLAELSPSISYFNIEHNQFDILINTTSISNSTSIHLSSNAWWCPLPTEPLWMMSLMGACIPATCQSISTTDCPMYTKRINEPYNTPCRGWSTCIFECCHRYAHSGEFQLVATIEDVLAEIDKEVNATTITKSENGEITVIKIENQDVPPTQNQSGTFLLIDDMGDGVDSMTAIMIAPEEANAIDVTMPELNKLVKYSTMVLKFERRNKDGVLVTNVPIVFYVCADKILEPFSIYRIEGPNNLTDITTIGGTVERVEKTGGLRQTNCDDWRRVTCPTTSSFVGVSPRLTCDNFTCPASSRSLLPPWTIPCPNDICNGLVCCVSLRCGNGIVEMAAGEECEPPNKACCNKQCRYKPKGAICRKPKGECDHADSCDGLSGRCSANGVHVDGKPCNIGGGKRGDHFACSNGRCRRTGRCGDGKVEGNEQCEPPQSWCCDKFCRIEQLPECLGAHPMKHPPFYHPKSRDPIQFSTASSASDL